jgi:hypothetical protein
MSRYGRNFRRFGRTVAMVAPWLLTIGLAIAGADAAQAFPKTKALLLGQAAADSGLIRAGFCPNGEDVCPDERSETYAPARVHVRRWEAEPEPEPYVRRERPATEDCVEQERYAAHSYVPRDRRVTRRLDESVDDDDFCGIRCWYRRLRNGYCGRGCDYYRFRLTEFPEGKLGRRHVQVACR